MKTSYILVALITSMALSCKEKTNISPSSTTQRIEKLGVKSQTRVVRNGDLQFAFDLMSIAAHKRVMKSMHLANMPSTEGATHGLIITIMNLKKKSQIKTATVKVQLTNRAGQHISKICTEMSAQSMHHYAAHLNLSNEKVWKVKAVINIEGQTLEASTKFEIL